MDGSALSVKMAIECVAGVREVRIIENRTRETVKGQDPHSARIIVDGGDDLEVAAAIEEYAPWTAYLVGDISVPVSSGRAYVRFSRPEVS